MAPCRVGAPTLCRVLFPGSDRPLPEGRARCGTDGEGRLIARRLQLQRASLLAAHPGIRFVGPAVVYRGQRQQAEWR